MLCLSSAYSIHNLTCNSQPLTMTSRRASGEVRASEVKRNPSTDFSRQSCGKTMHRDRSSWMWVILDGIIPGWDPRSPSHSLPPSHLPTWGKANVTSLSRHGILRGAWVSLASQVGAWGKEGWGMTLQECGKWPRC